MIDLFWEQPFTFAFMVHLRYIDQITDMFAGRIYERQPSTGIVEIRKLLKRHEECERSYEKQDLYSSPIGSRYHPERAPLWEANSPIQSTEEWMGPRRSMIDSIMITKPESGSAGSVRK